jgi:RNA polymerase primary sigma factor
MPGFEVLPIVGGQEVQMQTTDSFRPVPAAAKSLQQRPKSAKRRAVSPREIERLVEEARKLVPMFARRYLGRGVAFEDLVGAGNLGVVEAAHRFDASRGVKFGSYAAWWIRKAIVVSLGSDASVVSVPRFSFDRRRRVIEAITSGRAEGLRDFGTDDVASSLGLSAKQVEQALAFSIGAISLDAPVGVDDSRSIGERLASPTEKGPEAIVLDSDRTRCALAAMAVLSSRQRIVIALRFGVGGDGAEPASLTDVGRVMGISRERVRQIEGEALAAIRHELFRTSRKRRRA